MLATLAPHATPDTYLRDIDLTVSRGNAANVEATPREGISEYRNRLDLPCGDHPALISAAEFGLTVAMTNARAGCDSPLGSATVTAGPNRDVITLSSNGALTVNGTPHDLMADAAAQLHIAMGPQSDAHFTNHGVVIESRDAAGARALTSLSYASPGSGVNVAFTGVGIHATGDAVPNPIARPSVAAAAREDD